MLFLLAGCGQAQDASSVPEPYGEPPPPAVAVPDPSGPWPLFQDVSERAGITAENHTGKRHKKDWIVSAVGGGAIAADFDGDGDVDLLVVDGAMLTTEGNVILDDDHRTRLYVNDGDLLFHDGTAEAGIDVRGFGFGGAACDYDGDGDADVYICAWGRNWLLRNRGDGTFEDVTDEAGVGGAPTDTSMGCAWGDVNGDGVHDLYVTNYVDQTAQIKDLTARGVPGLSCIWRGFHVYCGPPGLDPQPDRLYLGRGDGTFREVTETHLVDQVPRYAFQPILTDVEGDGDLDVYVANDTQFNTLWINDGSGVFHDLGEKSATATNRDFLTQAGMGVDAADVNEDGRIDLVVTNFSHDYNTLYLNQTRSPTRPLFRDHSHTANLATASFLRLSWGVGLADFDLDGDLDLFTSCGHVYGEIYNFESTGTSYRQRNQILENQGPPDFRFSDATDRSGPGLALERAFRGATFADFDDDGDMDVFVTALNDAPALLRNDYAGGNRFLRIRLVGSGGQRDPAGARVTVHLPGGRELLWELHHGASFLGDNDPRASFGVGSAERVPRVVVRWPGGEIQEVADVATGRGYVLTQGGALEPEGEPR